MQLVMLGYCFTPYQRLWLYNGAPLVAFYDTLGIRRPYSRLKPPASSRGGGGGGVGNVNCMSLASQETEIHSAVRTSSVMFDA